VGENLFVAGGLVRDLFIACSGVRGFRCSGVRVFRRSGVRVFGRSGLEKGEHEHEHEHEQRRCRPTATGL
jgi:hypothetical protein